MHLSRSLLSFCFRECAAVDSFGWSAFACACVRRQGRLDHLALAGVSAAFLHWRGRVCASRSLPCSFRRQLPGASRFRRVVSKATCEFKVSEITPRSHSLAEPLAWPDAVGFGHLFSQCTLHANTCWNAFLPRSRAQAFLRAGVSQRGMVGPAG